MVHFVGYGQLMINYNYLKAIRNTGLFSSPDNSIPGFSVTS